MQMKAFFFLSHPPTSFSVESYPRFVGPSVAWPLSPPSRVRPIVALFSAADADLYFHPHN